MGEPYVEQCHLLRMQYHKGCKKQRNPISSSIPLCDVGNTGSDDLEMIKCPVYNENVEDHWYFQVSIQWISNYQQNQKLPL